MVRTRSNSKSTPPSQPNEPHEDNDDGSSRNESDDDIPKPVSSDSESDDTQPPTTLPGNTSVLPGTGTSRLFSPYRSLGVVSTGAPFHLIPHDHSGNAMVCVPIGDRFQLLRTDRLHPVLVSQAVPHDVQHVVTDATLSITVAAHGDRHVTLLHRTRPLATRALAASTRWRTVQLLPLGRTPVPMRGEKQGTMENAAIVAAILQRAPTVRDDVPLVGQDDDDDDNDDSESLDSDDNDDETTCLGQVVVLLATRDSIAIQRRIRLTALPNFRPTTALHPSTYLNKIVLGGTNQPNQDTPSSPAMCLLNVRSARIIHVFAGLPSETEESSVTTLEQSPAVDTIAVGTSSGNVHLINLRHDQKLFTLRHKTHDGNNVGISSISFRTDHSALQYDIAPMAVGRVDGHITIWDLTAPTEIESGRTVLHEMEHVHVGGVAKIQYLPQEPLLVSIGLASNRIAMHIFDSPDHSARLLRSRQGHTGPPTRIRYLHPGSGAGGGVLVNASDGTDASACQILSSGGPDRTLRVFSTARTVLDKEYSQGAGLEKKARKFGMDTVAELLLPPTIGLATAESRARDWGDLVTIHRDHAFAYVWSTKRGAQSGPILRQSTWNVSAMKIPPPPHTHATAVAMSACGNFALVGTRGGTIYKYNVQSGNTRGMYPIQAKEDSKPRRQVVAGDLGRTMKSLEKSMKVSNRAANVDKKELDAEQEAKRESRILAKLQAASHTGHSVTGLAVDSVNKVLISVGADAKLILWNFASHAPHKKSPYTLPCPATRMCHVRDSDLAAIALEDYSVVLFDCAALSIVRRFGATGGHVGPISDLGFSPDGRSLFTASLDSSLRVWDVPTNTCVDWLSFSTAPTSLTISPTGEFLATTHKGKLGISVWSDRTYYQTVNIDGTPLKEPARMDEPVPMADDAPSQTYTASKPSEERVPTGNESEVDGVDDKGPALPKEAGLITLSGLPPAHWKNLFHLELVKERNKPKEAPQKPPSAPFFLQWRSGESISETVANPQLASKSKQNVSEEEEWVAAWTDNDDDEAKVDVPEASGLVKRDHEKVEKEAASSKRRKVTRYRSALASLLEQCNNRASGSNQKRFQLVTDHIGKLGPSAIDVELSTLCSGLHDLEEGLPLLQLTCYWLLEALQSRERYDAVNAYLHRFLHLHASVIVGIDEFYRGDDQPLRVKHSEQERIELETQRDQRIRLLESITELHDAQKSASEALQNKMQNTLCLLRHFSRMI